VFVAFLVNSKITTEVTGKVWTVSFVAVVSAEPVNSVNIL